MITKEEIQVFETRLSELMANFKAQVMAELEKMGLPPDTFLEEISQPIQVVQDEPEKEGELPDLNGIEIPETKQELPFLEKGSDGWKGLVTYLMTKGIKEIPKAGKEFQLSERNWQYLKDLLYFKEQLFLGNMDVAQISSQGVDEEDKKWFLQMEAIKKELA